MKSLLTFLPVTFAMTLPLAAIPAFAQASAESDPAMASPTAPESFSGRGRGGTDAVQSQTSSTFVTKISDDNSFEIEAAKIALQKATLKEVKQFAERMVHDHTVAGDELKTAMAGEGVKLPNIAPLDQSNQEKITALQNLSGREFDEAYVQMMVMGHEQDIALVKTFLGSTQDPRLKVFAETVLPVMESHLREIDKIRRQEKMG